MPERIELILANQANQELHFAENDRKLTEIQRTLETIAIQEYRIDDMTKRLGAIDTQYEKAYGQGGYIDAIKAHQAQCPKETMQRRVNELWAAIALYGGLLVTGIWQIFKLHHK